MMVTKKRLDTDLAAKLREYADRTTGYIYEDETGVLRQAADRLERNGSDELFNRILADYDRRRSTNWGRLLLWLLKNTT